MTQNLPHSGTKLQNLDEILELFRSLSGIALPSSDQKKEEKTSNDLILEAIFNTPDEDFYQDSMEYFLSRGQNFAKYMKAVLGRDVTPVVGAKIKQFEQNDYLRLESEEEGCYVVKNSSVDWYKSIDFFAQQYKVSFEAMKEYLLMHEHAHTSQKGMDQNDLVVEPDVEEIILKYSTAMSVTSKDQEKEKFYDDIASIARQRLKEVERHYGN